MKKKVVFITSSLSQPRVIKRIKSIFDAGFNVHVYGFDRNVYNCNTIPNEIELTKVGNLKDGSGYSEKVKIFKETIDKIVDTEGTENVIYYSFALIPSFFLKRKSANYIYELSDLLYGYPKFNLIRPLLKQIEKRIIKRSIATVMTSEGFKNYLFGKNEISNIIIQPNKLNPAFSSSERPKAIIPDVNHLRFGFVGAIRYKNTILRFAKIIGKYFPQHEFHFYGDSHIVEEFKAETAVFKNVYFHGQFKNPDDLKQIYESIDLVTACYETGSLNERIAEPNKLYESVFFSKPIIVSNNSFLEKKIKKNKCGYSIDAYSDQAIIDLINNLTLDRILQIIEQEEKISPAELIDNPQQIINVLQNS